MVNESLMSFISSGPLPSLSDEAGAAFAAVIDAERLVEVDSEVAIDIEFGLHVDDEMRFAV